MKTQLYINGKFVDAVLGGTFPTINPANEEKICDVSAATKEDVDIAVAAAKACLYSPAWGYASTGAQRAVILRAFAEILTSRKEEIIHLECLDQGKPKREAAADIGDVLTACEHFAKLAEEQDSHQDLEVNNGTEGEFTSKIHLEPIGVVAAITPWNYPLLMAVWKVIPALAAGCCVVLKPSELAPLTCLLLGEMFTQAGLPDGALNVIPGLGPEAGGPLSAHMDVDKITFTGSGPTATRVMHNAAAKPTAVTTELGGKSPLIIFDDSEMSSVIDWVITGFIWGSGQVCSATSRVLVHENVKEKFMADLVEKLKGIKICDSLSDEVKDFTGGQMGPVVSKGQYLKIWKYIDDAKADGLNFFYGGDRDMVSNINGGKGYFIPPLVIDEPPISAAVWREEIFGPVVCVRAFRTEEEAINEANNTEYGLAAAVFSADLERCTRVSRQLRVGVVWKNCCQPAFVQTPWGGVKRSGFGRDLGKWGLEEFTSVKAEHSAAVGHSWGLW
jgi:betaine-aldehyde dehydrogenase